MNRHLSASLIALACSLGLSRAHAGEQVFFAFDDYSIPWQHNLKVTVISATKHAGNPVLRRGPEGAPDHGHAVLYGTVIKDGDKFRMWYLGMIETEIKAGNSIVSIEWASNYLIGKLEAPAMNENSAK